MSENDKVVCVCNTNPYSDSLPLTIGKIYTTISIEYSDSTPSIIYCKLRSDNGVDGYYNGNLFISLSEYRNRIIGKVLE